MKLITKAIFKSAYIFSLLIVFAGISKVNAQQSMDTVMAKVVALQADFVSKIKAAGYQPRLKPPTIVIDNPPSFGNYDNDKDILHTSDWTTLPQPLKDYFTMLGKSVSSTETGEQFFDVAAHKWIFIHEMGHWWRDCQQQTALPYDEEKAANRLAMAYWRERDPVLFANMLKVFQSVIDNNPSPVPAGMSKEKYLNDNYEKLPGGAAYSWYQSIMIVEASKEMPVLTFKQAVAQAGNAK